MNLFSTVFLSPIFMVADQSYDPIMMEAEVLAPQLQIHACKSEEVLEHSFSSPSFQMLNVHLFSSCAAG